MICFGEVESEHLFDFIVSPTEFPVQCRVDFAQK